MGHVPTIFLLSRGRNRRQGDSHNFLMSSSGEKGQASPPSHFLPLSLLQINIERERSRCGKR